MKLAQETPSEVDFLLNPAFCSCVLLKFVEAYASTKNRRPTFIELFLVLPLTLHRRSRQAILRRRAGFGVHRFALQSVEATVGLPYRVTSYAPFTKRGVALLFASGQLVLDADDLTVSVAQDAAKIPLSRAKIGEDAYEAGLAADRLGVWFSKLSPAEVFLHLGVKPEL